MGAYGDNFYSWLFRQKPEKVVLDGVKGDWKKDEHPRGQPENRGQFRQGIKSITRQDTVEYDDKEEMIELPGGKKIDASLTTLYTDDKGDLVAHKFSPFLKMQRGDGRISDAMDSILDRLFAGTDVDDAEIEATPEWKEAMEREEKNAAELQRKYGVTQTSDIDTEDRKELRRAIVKAAMSDRISKMVPLEGREGLEFETNEGLGEGESYEVEKGRKAFVCIGFPAAGKSTTFANPLAKQHKARLCDSDTVKKVLPEFDNGYGGNLVHEESTRINEAILAHAINQGDNIVYPILGYKPEKLRHVIDSFHKKGYSVALCFKDMPKTTAKGRLLVRFLQKGRYLPLSCISKVGDSLNGSFDANKEIADMYKRTTNKRPYGGVEMMIETKGMF